EFGLFDRAITLLAEHGIKTMMCTCSGSPPPWVFRKYPSILNTTAGGRVSNYGARYTVNHNDPTFVEISQRIDRAVVEHYAGNDAIIAWHIDNEIGAGNTCYSETTRKAFHQYLREKYESVQALNDAWGAHFWSFAFSDFDEVPLPDGVWLANPNLALEWARFCSKVNADFAMWRYNLIRKLDPGKWITTNFQGYNIHTDTFDLGAATDVYGTNLYPPFRTEFPIDYCRGARGELLILEQRSGSPHWREHTKPGWMRLWAWRSIGHGACGINFFRWRPCRWGQEEYWHGVLPHSGRENRRYRELVRMGGEIKQIGDLVDTTRPVSPVCIVMSHESRWALNAVALAVRSPFNKPEMSVEAAGERFHAALMADNVSTDAMHPREDLSPYKLVIAPRLYCVDEEVAASLCAYVKDGGVLCLTPRSGVVDQYNKVLDVPAPGPLREIAGVEIDDYGALDHGPVPLKATEKEPGLKVAEATHWADEIILTTAEVLAAYDEGWLSGMPAITLNRHGKGAVVCVGTVLEGESLAAFVTWLLDYAAVPRIARTPEGVRAHERRSDSLRLLFLLNYADEPKTVKLEEAWEDAFTGEEVRDAAVGPADLRILKRAL
ncbi:MAG: beta-galactosidase, partial [Planctomycetota bacterium]